MNDWGWVVPLVLVGAGLVFWGWMFRDLWANPDLPVNAPDGIGWPPVSKNTWTLVFIVLNIAGAAFYFMMVYRSRH